MSPTAFSYEEIARYQWLMATQTVTLAEAEVARMIYWCKSPNKEAVPDLVEMISLYTQALDCSERLDHTPLQIPEEQRAELAASGILTTQEIRSKCVELDAFMSASEQFRADLYQETLNQQLRQALKDWHDQLARIPGTKILDAEELDELLSVRDALEYARMGIHVIQMELRLPKVQYDQFARELQVLDNQLRDLLQLQDDQPLPYAPSTFWWRKV